MFRASNVAFGAAVVGQIDDLHSASIESPLLDLNDPRLLMRFRARS